MRDIGSEKVCAALAFPVPFMQIGDFSLRGCSHCYEIYLKVRSGFISVRNTAVSLCKLPPCSLNLLKGRHALVSKNNSTESMQCTCQLN